MTLFGDEEIKKWMSRTPPAFRDWLEAQINEDISRLMIASDLVTMGRFQGRLEVFKTLEQLRKES